MINDTYNNREFFELLKNPELVDIENKHRRKEIRLYVSLLLVLLDFEALSFGWLKVTTFTTLLTVFLCVAFIILFAIYTISSFQRNNYYFKNGDMSKGIKNYIFCAVVVYSVLVLLYFTIKDVKINDFILDSFVPVTTVLAAILAVMGVHYTHINQQKNISNKNKIVFVEQYEELHNSININECDSDVGINISLYNATANYGYFVGMYKVREYDVREVGVPILYKPILPNSGYLFTNIAKLLPYENLVLIYKDIGDCYYYLSFCNSENEEIIIQDSDKCDIEFIQECIQESISQDQKNKKKQETDQSHSNNKLSKNKDDFQINKRKEETKPINVKTVNGFDLIIDDEGEIITDTKLLTKLKNERLKISREKEIKAYLIFTNQQLVAIATYKPINKEEFISIYGLGEKKYELYGEKMIDLYK